MATTDGEALEEYILTTEHGVEVSAAHYSPGKVWLGIHDANDVDAGCVSLSIADAQQLMLNITKIIKQARKYQNASANL